MKKETKSILTVFVFSAIIRLIKLGAIPEGLSIEEVDLALKYFSTFGDTILNPFLVRLPFALFGIFTLFLFFLVLSLVFKPKKINVSIVSTLLLSISPWHLQQSRIYSPGMLIFGVLMLMIYFFLKKGISINLASKVLLGIGFFLFIVGVLSPTDEARFATDVQRGIARGSVNTPLLKIVSNKFVETYRQRIGVVFEGLDFGNYFFEGHPRERWGIEESPKLILSLLPLIFLGLYSVGRQLKKFLLGWSIFCLGCIFLFLWRGPSLTLFLVFPLITLSAFGVEKFWASKKRWQKKAFLLLAVFAIFETFVFGKRYIDGSTKSLFSPRRAIFKDMVAFIEENAMPGERVVVSDRLGESKQYFKFYLKDVYIEDYEFSDIEVSRKNAKEGLFVGVLPDDSSAAEPLYREDGSWPSEIGVLNTFYDENLRQKVVIYRQK